MARRASVCVTLDNFGESGEISLGVLPKGKYGGHDTAGPILDRLIRTAGARRLTYFVEGINAEHYPAQLSQIRSAGHEIGLHAWSHESWNKITLGEQRKLLDRSLRAFQHLGIEPKGFRPPGGEISADGLSLLQEAGFRYCSPVGSGQPLLAGDMVILPFEWRHVDAYLMDPKLCTYRRANGAPFTPVTLMDWQSILSDAVDEVVSSGGHLTVIFHPVLFGRDRAQWDVFEAFLDTVSSHSEIWMATAGDVAKSLAEPKGDSPQPQSAHSRNSGDQ